MGSISSDQGHGRRGGRQIPLVESEDQAYGFLFQLSEVRGADITAAVTFVPRPARTIGHLKLIMKEEREGGILQGERETELGFREEAKSVQEEQLHKPKTNLKERNYRSVEQIMTMNIYRKPQETVLHSQREIYSDAFTQRRMRKRKFTHTQTHMYDIGSKTEAISLRLQG